MKRYISDGRDLMLFINVNGSMEPIRFRDMGAELGYGMFITNNPVVASALEAHPFFNKYYRLESGFIEGQKEVKLAPAHVYEKEFDGICRTQGAIEILVKQYGVNRNEIKTKDQVLKKAFELNISFPKLAEKK